MHLQFVQDEARKSAERKDNFAIIHQGPLLPAADMRFPKPAQ
jgi:hypothetical protein